MTPLRRVAFIGKSLPRRCGIATFTTDLQQAVSVSRAGLDTAIVAMTDHGQAYDYPATVRLQIDDAIPEDYTRAARFLNAAKYDVGNCFRASMASPQGRSRSSHTAFPALHLPNPMRTRRVRAQRHQRVPQTMGDVSVC